MTNSEYAYVWEFFVKPEKDAEFREYYGATGRWVQLFRNGSGYRGTDLLQDLEHANRYVTVDHWQSQEAYTAFREHFAAELWALDEVCESLTERETQLGTFRTL